MAKNALVKFATATEAEITNNKAVITEDAVITFSDKNIYLGLGNNQYKRYDGADTSKTLRFIPTIRDSVNAVKQGPGLMFFDEADSIIKVTVQNEDGSIIAMPALEGVFTKKDSDSLKVDLYTIFSTHELVDTKLAEEKERATQEETKIKIELEAKAKACTYAENLKMNPNDFIVYGQSIYLVIDKFTTTGDFGVDKDKLFKLNSSGSAEIKVIDYVTGISIEEGNVVIYDGAIYISRNPIPNTTAWETDQAEMVPLSTKIDMTNYFTKTETQSLLANKQDKIPVGYGTTLDILVNFKQKAEDTAQTYAVKLFCLNNENTEPLVSNYAATFEKVDDYKVPYYVIVSGDETKTIKDYVNSGWVYCSNPDTITTIAIAKSLVEQEKQRAIQAESEAISAASVPSQSAIALHEVAKKVQAGQTPTYPAGTLFEFTASWDKTTGGDCYIFFVTLNSEVAFNNIDVELFQIGADDTLRKYTLNEFIDTNHIEGFNYPIDLTLLDGFGPDASFFYGLGQYLSTQA